MVNVNGGRDWSAATKDCPGSLRYTGGNPKFQSQINRKPAEAVRNPAKNLDINFANGDSSAFWDDIRVSLRNFLFDFGTFFLRKPKVPKTGYLILEERKPNP